MDEEIKSFKFIISRLKYENKQISDERDKMKTEKMKLKRKLETSIVFDPKNLSLDSAPTNRIENNKDFNKVAKTLKYNTGFDILDLYTKVCWDNSKMADEPPEFEIYNFEMVAQGNELKIT